MSANYGFSMPATGHGFSMPATGDGFSVPSTGDVFSVASPTSVVASMITVLTLLVSFGIFVCGVAGPTTRRQVIVAYWMMVSGCECIYCV